MGISIYNIKKWYKMMVGESIAHVNQGVGKCYSKEKIAGYYNDLTEKVTKDDPSILIPQYYVETGDKIYFSIGIFQYGLAAYDLYLTTHDEVYKNKLIACADWAVENQQDNGAWLTFVYKNNNAPYSSMAQGEGISMLIRATIVTEDTKYINATHRARKFMLKSIDEGGTTEYKGKNVIFYESTNNPVILNGWIFSLWGLFDYYKYVNDDETKIVLCNSLETLKSMLPDFDVKYWSKYDMGRRICSPFYHKLHIEQLNVMYDLFGDNIYKEYAEKWDGYLRSFWKCKKAFCVKAIQKIFER